MTGRNMLILPTDVVNLPSLLLLKMSCGRRVPGMTESIGTLSRQLFLIGPNLGALPPLPLPLDVPASLECRVGRAPPELSASRVAVLKNTLSGRVTLSTLGTVMCPLSPGPLIAADPCVVGTELPTVGTAPCPTLLR